MLDFKENHPVISIMHALGFGGAMFALRMQKDSFTSLASECMK
jgi:hypothetical protein